MSHSTEVVSSAHSGNRGTGGGESVVEKTHIILLFAFHGTIIFEQLISIVWLFRRGEEPSSVPIFAAGLIFTNIMLMISCGFLLFQFRKVESGKLLLEGQKSALGDQFEALKGVLAQNENLLSQERVANIRFNSDISKNRKNIAYVHTNYCGNILSRVIDSSPDGISHDFQNYIRRILEETAHLFTEYTEYKCTACIKIFKGGKGDLETGVIQEDAHTYLKTLARNPGSEADREAIDKGALGHFDYHKNTAFHRICASSKSPHYFVENDLQRRAELGDYDNENPNWRKHYNAVAVVPIRPPNAPVEQQSVGFLCVDNMQGGFDADRCVSILDGIASDLYFGINSTTSALQHIRKGRG